MSRIAIVLAAATVLAAAAPARASWWVQGIPGANCATDSRTTAAWEYRGQRLLNTASDPWAIVVATCPVSLMAPGFQPREYRLSLRDPQERDAWCKVYSSNGGSVRTHWMNWESSSQIFGTLDYPYAWSSGLVEVTIHCLVQSGASIDRIEIHRWKP